MCSPLSLVSWFMSSTGPMTFHCRFFAKGGTPPSIHNLFFLLNEEDSCSWRTTIYSSNSSIQKTWRSQLSSSPISFPSSPDPAVTAAPPLSEAASTPFAQDSDLTSSLESPQIRMSWAAMGQEDKLKEAATQEEKTEESGRTSIEGATRVKREIAKKETRLSRE
ncbi:hypothetical protein ZIOFF_039400 [Zingiber officinale]|uniref:Uncharacterized protein n=1 Tax=Zingiber officinale TaxID=94328 RepID=A0A8J5G151_ZINOF|nr:hypothetical protein ZIOFF_039400 [Zingiber officinale]